MSQSYMKNQPFVSDYGPVLNAAVSGGTPNVRLSDGLPVPVPTDTVNLSGTINALEPDFKSTRVQQFNVTVAKEFAGNLAAAAYVGSRGDRVAFVIPNINRRRSAQARSIRGAASSTVCRGSRPSACSPTISSRRTTRFSWSSSAAIATAEAPRH